MTLLLFPGRGAHDNPAMAADERSYSRLRKLSKSSKHVANLHSWEHMPYTVLGTARNGTAQEC